MQPVKTRKGKTIQQVVHNKEKASYREIPEKKLISFKPRTSTQKFLLFFFWSGWVILLSFSIYLFLLNTQGHCEKDWESQNIKVGLTSPEYISVGDIEELYVTAVNEGANSATISVMLAYTGDLLCLTEESGSNVIDFGSLSSRERATYRKEIQFPLCMDQLSLQNQPKQQIQFEMWVTINNQPQQLLGTVSLHTSPIPKAKKLSTGIWVLFAGLSTWLFKEMWDLTKDLAKFIVNAGSQSKDYGNDSTRP